MSLPGWVTKRSIEPAFVFTHLSHFSMLTYTLSILLSTKILYIYKFKYPHKTSLNIYQKGESFSTATIAAIAATGHRNTSRKMFPFIMNTWKTMAPARPWLSWSSQEKRLASIIIVANRPNIHSHTHCNLINFKTGAKIWNPRRQAISHMKVWSQLAIVKSPWKRTNWAHNHKKFLTMDHSLL